MPTGKSKGVQDAGLGDYSQLGLALWAVHKEHDRK